MTDSPQPFGRVPSAAVVCSLLAQADRGELAMYLALAAHAGGGNGDFSCWPSIERLASLTAMHPRTVQRGLNRLAARGAIAIERGGGRGRTTIYRLVTTAEKGGVQDAGVSAAEKGGVHDAGVSPERVASGDQNPGVSTPKPRRLDATRTEEQRIEQQQPAPARATEPPGDRAVAAAGTALTNAGFTPAAAADLAARYSGERIAEVLRWAGSLQRAGRLRGAPPAWIRRALEQNYEEPEEARAERIVSDGRQADDAARQRERRDAQRRRAEAAEAAARRDSVVAAVAALSPEARAAVLDAARQRFTTRPATVPDDWARFPTWVAWVAHELKARDELREHPPPLLKIAR